MTWVDVEQNTDEWQLFRLGKITASKFGVVMEDIYDRFGKTAHKYALKLALERINNRQSSNQIKTFHMKRGHLQEPTARYLYESQYFYNVTNGGFFDHGFYGDSPDGLVGTDGTVEIKSVIDSVQFATLKRQNYDSVYRWQMIGHIHCSGREWCDFVSYCADFPEGKQLLVYRMYRNDVEKDIEILKSRLEKFNKLVETKMQEIMMI